MKHLVIGLGEVGTALQKILDCRGYDYNMANPGKPTKADMIHICFPWGDGFIDQVKIYRNFCEAKYVVVHSSVPVGTCDEHGWTHSPIRGVHPNLEEGIRTFVKFVGHEDTVTCLAVAQELRKFGLETWTCQNAKNTEALKLWDTTQYGIMIALQKQIAAYCKKHHLNFDTVYTEGNVTYNNGYKKLGMEHVIRPVLKLKPGPIGGHCVIPNAKLLEEPGLSLVHELLDLQQALESAQEE